MSSSPLGLHRDPNETLVAGFGQIGSLKGLQSDDTLVMGHSIDSMALENPQNLDLPPLAPSCPPPPLSEVPKNTSEAVRLLTTATYTSSKNHVYTLDLGKIDQVAQGTEAIYAKVKGNRITEEGQTKEIEVGLRILKNPADLQKLQKESEITKLINENGTRGVLKHKDLEIIEIQYPPGSGRTTYAAIVKHYEEGSLDTLAPSIENHGVSPLTQEETLKVTGDIIEGLHNLRGFTMTDIRMDNILIRTSTKTKEKEAVIADYGFVNEALTPKDFTKRIQALKTETEVRAFVKQHVGLGVAPKGITHQDIDYISQFKKGLENIFSTEQNLETLKERLAAHYENSGFPERIEKIKVQQAGLAIIDMVLGEDKIETLSEYHDSDFRTARDLDRTIGAMKFYANDFIDRYGPEKGLQMIELLEKMIHPNLEVRISSEQAVKEIRRIAGNEVTQTDPSQSNENQTQITQSRTESTRTQSRTQSFQHSLPYKKAKARAAIRNVGIMMTKPFKALASLGKQLKAAVK